MPGCEAHVSRSPGAMRPAVPGGRRVLVLRVPSTIWPATTLVAELTSCRTVTLLS